MPIVFIRRLLLKLTLVFGGKLFESVTKKQIRQQDPNVLLFLHFPLAFVCSVNGLTCTMLSRCKKVFSSIYEQQTSLIVLTTIITESEHLIKYF